MILQKAGDHYLLFSTILFAIMDFDQINLEKLAFLPTNLLLYFIPSYLCKSDQYQWFSTCKAWKPRLLENRSIYISEEIPYKEYSACATPNVYLWSQFISSSDPRRILEMVGCGLANRPLRKVRLNISRNELLKHEEKICAIAENIYFLHIFNNFLSFDQNYYPPITWKDPTALSIKRLLQSAWIVREDKHLAWPDVIFAHVEKVNDAVECNTITSCSSNRQALSGVNKVIIQKDKKCYVEFGPDEKVDLQSIAFEYCDSVYDVPTAHSIKLLHCQNINQINTLAKAEHVHLEGLTIDDLSMLGGVKKLVVRACQVNHYPVPTLEKGQHWEFSMVNMQDVSVLKSLEQLTLWNCNHVEDGSTLGGVQKLTLIGGKMKHYPVPWTGKQQFWAFSGVGIVDVSKLATLEGLKLVRCNQVTDISKLGAVRYLTIERCAGLVKSAKYPSPTGRLQEWTFAQMYICKTIVEQMVTLHRLTLIGDEITDI